MIDMYTLAELQEFRSALVQELKNSEKDEKTSLAFARHTINREQNLGHEEVQVIVVGGSNMECAIAKKNGNSITFHQGFREKLPVLASKNTLFKILCHHLNNDIDIIGLNFAYPLSPLYRGWKLDGNLLRATKEHTLDDLIGKPVGRELEQYIIENLKRKVDIVLANDAVCLILAGLQICRPESLAGGVIGTGFNFGFFIDDTTVVNLESGNFNRFRQTESGKEIDRVSDNPGEQLWEKEVSGAYLFRHYNIMMKDLHRKSNKLVSSKELTNLALDSGQGSELARMVLKRSASLVAVELAAIYDFKGVDTLTFAIEGSLFWKGFQYRETVNEYLEKLGITASDIVVKHIANSSIVGAARLIF